MITSQLSPSTEVWVFQGPAMCTHSAPMGREGESGAWCHSPASPWLLSVLDCMVPVIVEFSFAFLIKQLIFLYMTQLRVLYIQFSLLTSLLEFLSPKKGDETAKGGTNTGSINLLPPLWATGVPSPLGTEETR